MGQVGDQGEQVPRVFVRSFLSRYFVGELAKSIYGLFVFVMFAVTLTAWLPDALESGDLWFTMGTIFYFLSLIFATAFVYPAPEKKEKSPHPAKTKYLVYALSVPSPNRPWTFIEKEICENLRKNNTRTNINPLYSSLYYHIDRIERLYLLVTENGHLKDGETIKSIKDQLEMFFRKAVECLNESRKQENKDPAKFRIYWEPFSVHGEVEEIGDGSRAIEVRFLNIGDSNDVKGMFDETVRSEITNLIEKESNEVTFNLTGGRAATSIAMMLYAIKGGHARRVQYTG